MEEFKLWWQSKTIWGAIITSISLLLYLLGVGPMLGGDDIVRIVDLMLLLFGSGGLLTTVIGRYMAKAQVTLTTPTAPPTQTPTQE